MDDDNVLTPAAYNRLTALVREADDLAAWHRQHPQRLPFPDATQHENGVRFRRVWTASARQMLRLRERWADARRLIASDVDRHLLDADGRYALAGLYREAGGWGRPFSTHVLATGRWKGQHPVDVADERKTFAWRDCYRALDAQGDARPAIIVAHCRDPERFEQLAREHDLTVERLPWSWFRPNDCVAVAVAHAGIPSVARRAASAST